MNLGKSFQIIDALATFDFGQSVNTIAYKARTESSTAYKWLEILVSLGYVKRVPGIAIGNKYANKFFESTLSKRDLMNPIIRVQIRDRILELEDE